MASSGPLPQRLGVHIDYLRFDIIVLCGLQNFTLIDSFNNHAPVGFLVPKRSLCYQKGL